MHNDSNFVYIELLKKIITVGTGCRIRGYDCRELISNSTVVDMRTPLITLTARKLGYKFAVAEAAWVLSGDNRVSSMEKYSKMIKKFSDDGIVFYGAYGPKVVDQLSYVCRCLSRDLYSRQAVISIWREKPDGNANDIPCTLSIQFLIRKDPEDVCRLHLIDTMRSSDAWLGIPYDWFTFSVLGLYTILYLRRAYEIYIEPGNLIVNAGNQHLYNNAFGYNLNLVQNVISAGVASTDFSIAPVDLKEFSGPDDLVDHLWSLARTGRGISGVNWLSELSEYWSKK